MTLSDKQFEEIHKAFCKSYGIVGETPWRKEQKQYKMLKKKIDKLTGKDLC